LAVAVIVVVEVITTVKYIIGRYNIHPKTGHEISEGK
jgi:hypothetical protein